MTTRESAGGRNLTSEEFRDVVGRFASGVTVITTRVDGEPFGTTASAVSSLSLEPPMLLICMNQQSSTGQAIARAGRFAVNILGEDQPHLAGHFARKGADKFAGVTLRSEQDAVPVLSDALATLECRVSDDVVAGTHVVFIAEVERASGRSGPPLAYFRGKFGRFELAKSERPATVEAAVDWMPALFAMLLGAIELTLETVPAAELDALGARLEGISLDVGHDQFVGECLGYFEQAVRLARSEALLEAFRRAELSEMVIAAWSDEGPGPEDRRRILDQLRALHEATAARDPAAVAVAARGLLEFTSELLRRTFRTATDR